MADKVKLPLSGPATGHSIRKRVYFLRLRVNFSQILWLVNCLVLRMFGLKVLFAVDDSSEVSPTTFRVQTVSGSQFFYADKLLVQLTGSIMNATNRVHTGLVNLRVPSQFNFVRLIPVVA